MAAPTAWRTVRQTVMGQQLGGMACTEYEHVATKLRLVRCIGAPTPVSSATVVVPTAAVDNSGLPHCLEHLCFLGTATHQRGVLDALAQRHLSNGTNAWTLDDHTAYTCDAIGETNLLAVLPTLLHHVVAPLLSNEGFITEVHHVSPDDGSDSGVVFNEMLGCESSEGDIRSHFMQRQLYAGTHYDKYFGGLTKDIRRLTNDRIRRYHEHFYRLSRLCIVVLLPPTAAVSPMQTFDCLEPTVRHLASTEPSPPPSPSKGQRTETGKRGKTKAKSKGDPILQPIHRPPHFDALAPLSPTIHVKHFPSTDTSCGSISLGWRFPHSQMPLMQVWARFMCDTSSAPLQRQYVERPNAPATDVGYEILEFTVPTIVISLSGISTQLLTTPSRRRDLCADIARIVGESLSASVGDTLRSCGATAEEAEEAVNDGLLMKSARKQQEHVELYEFQGDPHEFVVSAMLSRGGGHVSLDALADKFFAVDTDESRSCGNSSLFRPATGDKFFTSEEAHAMLSKGGCCVAMVPSEKSQERLEKAHDADRERQLRRFERDPVRARMQSLVIKAAEAHNHIDSELFLGVCSHGLEAAVGSNLAAKAALPSSVYEGLPEVSDPLCTMVAVGSKMHQYTTKGGGDFVRASFTFGLRPEDAPVALLVTYMVGETGLVDGTTHFEVARRIDDDLTGHSAAIGAPSPGARFSPSVGSDMLTLAFTARADKAAMIPKWANQLVCDAEVTEERLAVALGRLENHLSENLRDTYEVACDVLNRALYNGDDPANTFTSASWLYAMVKRAASERRAIGKRGDVSTGGIGKSVSVPTTPTTPQSVASRDAFHSLLSAVQDAFLYLASGRAPVHLVVGGPEEYASVVTEYLPKHIEQEVPYFSSGAPLRGWVEANIPRPFSTTPSWFSEPGGTELSKQCGKHVNAVICGSNGGGDSSHVVMACAVPTEAQQSPRLRRALELACEAFSMGEGPLYSALRGKGLAYGCTLSYCVMRGTLELDIDEVEKPVEAFQAARHCIEETLQLWREEDDVLRSTIEVCKAILVGEKVRAAGGLRAALKEVLFAAADPSHSTSTDLGSCTPSDVNLWATVSMQDVRDVIGIIEHLADGYTNTDGGVVRPTAFLLIAAPNGKVGALRRKLGSRHGSPTSIHPEAAALPARQITSFRIRDIIRLL